MSTDTPNAHDDRNPADGPFNNGTLGENGNAPQANGGNAPQANEQAPESGHDADAGNATNVNTAEGTDVPATDTDEE